jgi:hypothetical protein
MLDSFGVGDAGIFPLLGGAIDLDLGEIQDVRQKWPVNRVEMLNYVCSQERLSN